MLCSSVIHIVFVVLLQVDIIRPWTLAAHIVASLYAHVVILEIFITDRHIVLQHALFVDHVLVEKIVDRSSLDLKLSYHFQLHAVKHLAHVLLQLVHFQGHLLVDVRVQLLGVELICSFNVVQVQFIILVKRVYLVVDFVSLAFLWLIVKGIVLVLLNHGNLWHTYFWLWNAWLWLCLLCFLLIILHSSFDILPCLFAYLVNGFHFIGFLSLQVGALRNDLRTEATGWLALWVVLVGEPDAINSRLMTLQSKSYRAALSQIVDQTLLILPIHRRPHRQRVTILSKMHTSNRKRSLYLLNNQLIINIIEYDLPIQSNRAHEQLIKWTETDSSHIAWVLVKLTQQLLGVHVVETHCTVVSHWAEGVFY